MNNLDQWTAEKIKLLRDLADQLERGDITCAKYDQHEEVDLFDPFFLATHLEISFYARSMVEAQKRRNAR